MVYLSHSYNIWLFTDTATVIHKSTMSQCVIVTKIFLVWTCQLWSINHLIGCIHAHWYITEIWINFMQKNLLKHGCSNSYLLWLLMEGLCEMKRSRKAKLLKGADLTSLHSQTALFCFDIGLAKKEGLVHLHYNFCSALHPVCHGDDWY